MKISKRLSRQLDDAAENIIGLRVKYESDRLTHEMVFRAFIPVLECVTNPRKGIGINQPVTSDAMRIFFSEITKNIKSLLSYIGKQKGEYCGNWLWLIIQAYRNIAQAAQNAIKKSAKSPIDADVMQGMLAPYVEAMLNAAKNLNADEHQIDKIAPQISAERRKAQIAWIQKTESCTEIERKTALLRTDGMTLTEIAKRLPHKNGKPMTRQGVRQALLRFAKKAGQIGLFSKGTYRQNVRSESEAKEPDEDCSVTPAVDK